MIYTSDASNIVCGHCGGLVKGSCCWMAGKAYHNSCYSLLMGIERGLASVIDKDARIAVLEAERDQLLSALKSIANNTCCTQCQEAALVAKQALNRVTGK